MERQFGKVLFYLAQNGKFFGFIEPDYEGAEEMRPPDVFFSWKGLGDSCGRIGRRKVEANQRVSFLMSEYKGRPTAVDIQKETRTETNYEQLDLEINGNR